VHYKGQYYCFNTDEHSFSRAKDPHQGRARDAIEAGGVIAGLRRAGSEEPGIGTLCTVVDLDALGVQGGQLVAFHSGTTCVFDPQSGKRKSLSDAAGLYLDRAFEKGVLLGNVQHCEEPLGTNCVLIETSVGSPRAADEVVFHYRDRFYAVDTHTSKCAPVLPEMESSASRALESGTSIGAFQIGDGCQCFVLDLSGLSQEDQGSDLVLLLRNVRGTVAIDLGSGEAKPADGAWQAATDAAVATGSWVARLPAPESGATSCVACLVDLSALRPQAT
jgi:hypothetical protein